MRESLYRSYSLRGTELALLLASEKKESVHSFAFIDGGETKEDYVYAVDHMIKQGIASPEGDRLVVREPYREMICCMRNAKSVITLRSSDDWLNDYCIYTDGSDKVLAMSMSTVRRGSVLLTHTTPEDLVETVLPDTLFPEELPDSADPEELSEDVFPIMLRELRDVRDINDVRFIVGFDEFSTDNSERYSVIVMSLPQGLYTARYEDGGVKTEIYNKKSFKEELLRVVRGDFRL